MSEYKRYGRSEDLLETYLPAYDNKLVQSMIQEARVQQEQIGRFMLKTEPESFTIKGIHQETAYWEISFTLPVIQYTPECFRFITRNPMYMFQYGQCLECVPSYIPNINHLTLLNSYNNNNPEFIYYLTFLLTPIIIDTSLALRQIFIYYYNNYILK